MIGVVADTRDDGVDKPVAPTTFWPLLVTEFWGEEAQVRRSITLIVRSDRVGSETFVQEIRQAVWAVNGSLPVSNVTTMDVAYRKSMGRTSFALVMLAIAGGMALLLGVVGIYGVLSYAVTQRTREIGIRMALDAQHGELHQMFLRRGLILAGIGIALGLAISAAAMQWMKSLLFGITALDLPTYSVVAATLIVAALAASYLPARRATAIDPVEALRAE